MYSESALPLAYIFVEATDPAREAITKAIEPIAREHKGKINFVWIDATKVSKILFNRHSSLLTRSISTVCRSR